MGWLHGVNFAVKVHHGAYHIRHGKWWELLSGHITFPQVLLARMGSRGFLLQGSLGNTLYPALRSDTLRDGEKRSKGKVSSQSLPSMLCYLNLVEEERK